MAAYEAFLGIILSSIERVFLAQWTIQSLFCLDNKVDYAFNETENDAQERYISRHFWHYFWIV